MLIHLVPLGRDRYDLYSEVPEADEGPPADDAGRIRRWLHAAGEQWREYVDRARLATDTGRFARMRDGVINRLADSLDELRTLRGLRTADAATLLFPAGLDEASARAVLDRLLGAERRYHGRRLVVYLTLFVLSGALAVLPGPNVVAYYFGFQGVGHLQAWRGARHAAVTIAWTLTPSADLSDLASLAERPHGERTAQVAAIAHRLHLDHLPAFFERAAS